MMRTRTPFTPDERPDRELIEAALRRELGFDLLEELWDANVGATEAEVETTVADALRAVRRAAKTLAPT